MLTPKQYNKISSLVRRWEEMERKLDEDRNGPSEVSVVYLFDHDFREFVRVAVELDLPVKDLRAWVEETKERQCRAKEKRKKVEEGADNLFKIDGFKFDPPTEWRPENDSRDD